jgi:hypothetical protein
MYATSCQSQKSLNVKKPRGMQTPERLESKARLFCMHMLWLLPAESTCFHPIYDDCQTTGRRIGAKRAMLDCHGFQRLDALHPYVTICHMSL